MPSAIVLRQTVSHYQRRHDVIDSMTSALKPRPHRQHVEATCRTATGNMSMQQATCSIRHSTCRMLQVACCRSTCCWCGRGLKQRATKSWRAMFTTYILMFSLARLVWRSASRIWLSTETDRAANSSGTPLHQL